MFVSRFVPSPGKVMPGVTKLSARTGRALWARGFGRPVSTQDFTGDVRAMEVAANGDVVAAVNVNIDSATAFVIARLDGRTGAFRWRREIGDHTLFPEGQVALSLALDPAGDVIVQGRVASPTAPPYANSSFTVVKLDGATGEERWRFQTEEFRQDSAALRMDARGDAVIAGAAASVPLRPIDPRIIVKLAGADGHEQWRAILDLDNVYDTTVDTGGDVLVAGSLPGVGDDVALSVVKLSGDTGMELWRSQRFPVSMPSTAYALRVVALADDNVAALGGVAAPEDSTALGVSSFVAVTLLDGSTGAERWRWTVKGDQNFAAASSLRVSGSELLVSARVLNAHTCWDMLFVRLDAATGQPLGQWLVDGTEQATQCILTCIGDARGRTGSCRPTGHRGVDSDQPLDFFTDARGRGVLAGMISDLDPGPSPHSHGIVRRVPRLDVIAAGRALKSW